jgi:hypothetical protein
MGVEAGRIAALRPAPQPDRIHERDPKSAGGECIPINIVGVRRGWIARIHQKLNRQFVRHIGEEMMRHHALRVRLRVVIHREALNDDAREGGRELETTGLVASTINHERLHDRLSTILKLELVDESLVQRLPFREQHQPMTIVDAAGGHHARSKIPQADSPLLARR